LFVTAPIELGELSAIRYPSSSACIGGTNLHINNQCDEETRSIMFCVKEIYIFKFLSGGRCAEGYSYSGIECIKCSSTNGGMIFAFVLYSFAFVLFIFKSSNNVNSTPLVSQFFYFTQIAIVLIQNDSKSFASWINIFNLNIQSAGTCVTPLTAYESLAVDVFVPLFYLFILFASMFVHFVVSKTTTGNNNGIVFSRVRYSRAFLSMYLICFTRISQVSLRSLHCIHVGDSEDSYVLFSVPSISCNDRVYKSWVIFMILLLIITLLFPCLVIAYLLYHRAEFISSSSSSNFTSSFVHQFGVNVHCYESASHVHVVTCWSRGFCIIHKFCASI
jgi:hypothetical protein